MTETSHVTEETFNPSRTVSLQPYRRPAMIITTRRVGDVVILHIGQSNGRGRLINLSVSAADFRRLAEVAAD